MRLPSQPEQYVRRPRLLELLDHAARTSLTLVIGPPGAGKTVLVAGWAEEPSWPTVWLSLDDADMDGAVFWSGVVATLEPLVPCGLGDVATVLAAQGGPERVVGELLERSRR